MLVLALVLAMMALTWLLGWWGVALVAAVAGLVLAERIGVAGRTALAAAVAWGALLAGDALRGPLGVVAGTLGGVMHLPGAVLVLLTLAFPALLAWSAATVASASRRLMPRRR